NEPEITGILAVLTSLAVAALALKSLPALRGKTHVSRQSPNSRGRKGTAQSPRGIQTGNRREVQHAILHHQPGWQGWPGVSLRGMGTDRAEAGRALHLQSYEEKVSGPGELLRASGGDGWSGAAAVTATLAGSGAAQRRSCGDRQSQPSRGSQPGRVSRGDRGATVHT